MFFLRDKNVKLALSKPLRYIGRMEVLNHSFLTSAVDESDSHLQILATLHTGI